MTSTAWRWVPWIVFSSGWSGVCSRTWAEPGGEGVGRGGGGKGGVGSVGGFGHDAGIGRKDSGAVAERSDWRGKGLAPADPLRTEVRELQEAERIWYEEPGAVWGGEREIFPKGQPEAGKVQEQAWTELPAGWEDFSDSVLEMANAGPGTELSGKARKLLENIVGLEAGRAEFVFNRRSGVLSGEPARYAGSVARGYVQRLVAWRLGRTRRLGEYAQRLAQVRKVRRSRAGMLRFADLPQIAQDEVVQVAGLAYRLDGWFDHWLLDEFQDTSRSQWAALEPS